MRNRNLQKYSSRGLHSFSTLEEAVSHPIKVGLTSIKSNNRYFDFLYEDRQSAVTLITFHSALNASTNEYPIFSGSKFAEELGCNLLAFADASCGGLESLPTFWHLSTKRVNSSTIIKRIISHAATTGTGEHLVFFGSSAGGYAALNYSTSFPGSVAVVLNPRIELEAKPYRFEKFSHVSYPGWSPEKVASKLPTSMATHYSEPRNNKVLYLQNAQDNLYYNYHYNTFRISAKACKNIYYKVKDWGIGHVLPPRDEYMDPLRDLIKNAPHWDAILKEHSTLDEPSFEPPANPKYVDVNLVINELNKVICNREYASPSITALENIVTKLKEKSRRDHGI